MCPESIVLIIFPRFTQWLHCPQVPKAPQRVQRFGCVPPWDLRVTIQLLHQRWQARRIAQPAKGIDYPLGIYPWVRLLKKTNQGGNEPFDVPPRLDPHRFGVLPTSTSCPLLFSWRRQIPRSTLKPHDSRFPSLCCVNLRRMSSQLEPRQQAPRWSKCDDMPAEHTPQSRQDNEHHESSSQKHTFTSQHRTSPLPTMARLAAAGKRCPYQSQNCRHHIESVVAVDAGRRAGCYLLHAGALSAADASSSAAHSHSVPGGILVVHHPSVLVIRHRKPSSHQVRIARLRRTFPPMVAVLDPEKDP